ncbi:MAG: dihydropteroate synthase [Planctomycetes bacterium]|nr:dihydropteroate synthase [Planctomycetota bacterium]
MPHLLFLTGKLAEPALRRTLMELAPRAGFEYTVGVLPITVAALATTPWIATHFTPPAGVDRMILPGLCHGSIDVLQQVWGNLLIEKGPNDLRDLPDFFGAEKDDAVYGGHDIEILAEINHAPRHSRSDLLTRARKARSDGADVIDLGCDPGTRWAGIADTVKALRDEGLRVSLDTFDPHEAAAGARAGAELILSVNRVNRVAAADWGCEVVAIPDTPAGCTGLADTVDYLHSKNVPFRIDPVLEPIAFGFAESLGRYLETRKKYPQVEMMMGVGNLTELTDADSAGINVLLAGFCQELSIHSVLTTEVINWAQSSVRELDLARRLIHFACQEHQLPKRREPNLILLRDPKLREHGEAGLRELAASVSDRNFRLFAERGKLHVINGAMWLQGTDPFELFAQMQQRADIDPAHAFYLGYELAKALTALTLGKNYVQDQALCWGFLTLPEKDRHG